MKCIIDSSAWVEYLDGTPNGLIVEEILQNESNQCYTSIISIAEVISRAKRTDTDTDIAYKAITENSITVYINEELSKKAGLKHAELRKTQKDFGLADAIIWVQAEENKLTIVAKDKHFSKFKNVKMLGEK